MDILGEFDQQMEGSDHIPRYDRSGRLLTQSERETIALRKGQCLRCGVKTHTGRLLGRKGITDENVYNGICIRCNPDQVPAEALEAWEQHSRMSPSVRFDDASTVASASQAECTGRRKRKEQARSLTHVLGGKPCRNLATQSSGRSIASGESTMSSPDKRGRRRFGRNLATQNSGRSIASAETTTSSPGKRGRRRFGRNLAKQSSGRSIASAESTASSPGKRGRRQQQQTKASLQTHKSESVPRLTTSSPNTGVSLRPHKSDIAPRLASSPNAGAQSSSRSLVGAASGASTTTMQQCLRPKHKQQRQGLSRSHASDSRSRLIPSRNVVSHDSSLSLMSAASAPAGWDQQRPSLSNVSEDRAQDSPPAKPLQSFVSQDSNYSLLSAESAVSITRRPQQRSSLSQSTEKGPSFPPTIIPARGVAPQDSALSLLSATSFTSCDSIDSSTTFDASSSVLLGQPNAKWESSAKLPAYRRRSLDSTSTSSTLNGAAALDVNGRRSSLDNINNFNVPNGFQNQMMKSTSDHCTTNTDIYPKPVLSSTSDHGTTRSMGRNGNIIMSGSCFKSTTYSNHSGRNTIDGGASVSTAQRRARRVRSTDGSNYTEGTLRPLTTRSMNDDWTGGKLGGGPSEMIQKLEEFRRNPIKLRKCLHRLRNTLTEQDKVDISAITSVMFEHWQDPRIMDVASGVLWKLSTMGEHQKHEIIESGAIELVIDALRLQMDDHDFAEWAMGLLASVASAQEHKVFIAQLGLVKVVLQVVRRHPEWVGALEWACRCLHALLSHDDDYSDSCRARQKVFASIEEFNGVSVIVRVLDHHSNENAALLWATRILRRLLGCANEAEKKRVLRRMENANFIAIGFDILRQHPTNSELLRLLSQILSIHLLDSDCDQRTFRSASEWIPSFVMWLNVGDESLQESSSLLLFALSNGERTVKQCLKESSAIKAIVEAIAAASDNSRLALSGCLALWKLSSEASLFDASLITMAVRELISTNEANKDSIDILLSTCGFISNVCKGPGTDASDFPVFLVLRTLELQRHASIVSSGVAERALLNLCYEFPRVVEHVGKPSVLTAMVQSLSNPSCGCKEVVCSTLAFAASNSKTVRASLRSSDILTSAALLLEESIDLCILSAVLDLISALGASEDESEELEIPSFNVNVVGRITRLLNRDFFGGRLREKCCSTLIHALVLSTQVDVDEVVDCMAKIISSPASSDDLRFQACRVLWFLSTRYKPCTKKALGNAIQSAIVMMKTYNGEGMPLNEQALSVAASALCGLTAISNNDSDIFFAKAEADAMISTLYKIMAHGNRLVETAANILFAILQLCHEHASAFTACGAIVAVIDIMEENARNESIQHRGCAILALLSSSANAQVNMSIAQTDGIDVIVSALPAFLNNAQIQTEAAKAFTNLSVDPQLRMIICSQGGLHLMVAAIKTHHGDSALLQSACLALLNLTSDAEEEFIAGSDIIDAVVQTMRSHPSSSILQIGCMGILQNISMMSPTAKQSVAEAGGIDAIIATIDGSLGVPSVLERAFSTLWSLAVLEANQTRIVKGNGIPLVINGMLASIAFEGVQRQGCGCLCTLSSSKAITDLIHGSGGVDAIVFAMWVHLKCEAFLSEACRALSEMAIGSYTNEPDAEMSAIISAMKQFPKVESIQANGCTALLNYMKSSAYDATIKGFQKEINEMVNNAATTFADSCSEPARQIISAIAE